MPNKKLFIISLILLIIIISVFFYMFYSAKKLVDHSEDIQPTKETAEPKQVSPLKQATLSTDKQIYNPDEEIKITAIIRNPFPEIKNWTAVYYFMSADETSFSALGQTRELELKPSQTEKVEFTSLVSQNLPPGDYKVKLEILEQEQIINTKSKIIKIQGTDKILSAQLQICQDNNCETEKYVFLQNETIYIKINSAVPNVDAQGEIKYPDQEKLEELSFKNNLAVITADQLGSYEVIINITKDGYQNAGMKKDFAVIEAEPQIKNTSKCNANGKCDGEENTQNCPQDCL